MKKDGRYLKDKNHIFAKALVPLALTTVLMGCDESYTPAEPHTAAPLADAERDLSGNSNVEYLDRGLIVIPGQEDGNIISWRMSGLDEQRIIFKVYKNGEFFRTVRPKEPTFLEDSNGLPTDTYQVIALVDDVEKDASKVVKAQEKPYLAIPLNTPDSDFVDGVEYFYTANDASAADLTGDGQYELIVKWEPSNSKDNSQAGKTGNVLLDAYTMEGELLWRINLGQNIRAGAHYTQFMAFDFNQDGRAEVAVKTAEGTKDAQGNFVCSSTVVCDNEADHRNDGGYVLSGPEFLTMFDGLSGEALDTIDYVPERGNVQDWGDGYGNRVDRFLAGVAYLDGKKPSLVMSRGYYTRAVVASYDFVDNKFVQKWVYDSDLDDSAATLAGQGAHSLSIADVDSDGADEIIFGAATLDNDGSLLYSTELGHGDALHVADIIPDRPGLEVFMVHECPSCYTKDGVEYGSEIHDAATGTIIHYQSGEGTDVGRGVTGDIDPNYPGMESWGSRGGLMAADGTIITDVKPAMNFMVWWDDDLSREILDGSTITKWNAEDKLVEKTPLFDALTVRNGSGVSNNGTKATPALSGDIIGDWREEVVMANEDSSRLLIYTTNYPTEVRLPTLMHDRQYRTAIAWQNTAYNQPPHPSFYLGTDMKLYQHELAELPQYKTTGVAMQGADKIVAQGNNNNVIVKVYSSSDSTGTPEIFRSETNDASTRTSVGMLAEGSNTFVDTTAVPDKTYYYWVEGYDMSSMARMTSTLIPRVEAASSNNYVDLTWVTKLQLSDIKIYRAETTDMGVIPAKPDAHYAMVNPRARTWTDENTTDGTKYYYWVELTTTDGNVAVADPVFAENLIAMETNLDYTYQDSVMTICWDLKNFPTVNWSQLYRNDQNQAAGRVKIHDLTADTLYQGCTVDAVTPVEGASYWYMFKYNTAEGTPTSEIVGPFIPGPSSTSLVATADAVLQTINLEWNLRNFGQSIKNVDLYRGTSVNMENKTLVRSNVRAIDGRLRDIGGDAGFTDGARYWYAFEITLADDSVVTTTAEGNVLFELPKPESNLITRLEDGGIRIDWNLKNYNGVFSSIEILRNTQASVDDAIVIVSEGIEGKGAYADYQGLVETLEYWYMMRVTLDDGTVIVDDPTTGIQYFANPTATAVTIEENEDGYCEITGVIESNWVGYEGEGFSNTDNAEGMYVSYKVNVQEDGTYRFILRYANGSGDNRFANVDINNSSSAFSIDMEPTGTWDTWAESFASFDLLQGDTEIKLKAGMGGGLANLDSLTIDNLTGSKAPVAIACAP
ncbi:carbohydrate-binding protein [Catenovulum sp. SX2]|uniref:rhamnogalacturonan lyase family protein n=1 Tax=Catenovulum sp. SX2 TaxID=3398614 RepID=UPI003F87EB42